MCPFISSITTSDMPIHIPSKYHHFILRDTTYQMKYLIPKSRFFKQKNLIKQTPVNGQFLAGYPLIFHLWNRMFGRK